MIRQVFFRLCHVQYVKSTLSTLLSIQKPGLWPLNLMTGRNCDEVWGCETNSWIRYDVQKWEKPTEMEDVSC